MSEPLQPGELADIKAFVEDLKLPEDASQGDRCIYATVKGDMALLVAEVERLRGLPLLENAEARRRIQQIQKSTGLDRENFPDDMKGSLARDKWDDPMFSFGMEYGYMLAMLDIVQGTDSVTPTPDDSTDEE